MMMGAFQAPPNRTTDTSIPRPSTSRGTLPPPPMTSSALEDDLPDLDDKDDEVDLGVEEIVSEATGEMRADSTEEILEDLTEEIRPEIAREMGVSPVVPDSSQTPVPPSVPVPAATPQEVEEEELDEFEIEPAGLMRPLFSETTLRSFEMKGLPDGLLGLFEALRLVHALAAAAVIVIIVGVVVALSGEDAAETPAEIAGADQEGKEKPEAPPKAKESEEKPEVAKEKQPAEDTAAKEAPKEKEAATAPPVPDLPGKCKPFSSFPKFPWSTHIDSLLDAAGKSGVCELFGTAPKAVASALKDSPQYGPTGYDLLPGAQLFEIFPVGTAERRAPTMEFVFIGEKLFEIRLNYGHFAGDGLKNTLFEAALGKPSESGTDLQGRKFKRYFNDDLVVEQKEKKDRYRRVFREVVFYSKAIHESLREKDQLRREAQAAFAKAMDAFNQRKSDKALKRFEKARGFIPEYGAAHVLAGITYVRQEMFEQADALAAKALQVSRDHRAHAEAKGLRAVAALYNKKKNDAIALFRSANELDPTNGEFGNAVSELDTGKYQPARVAKTAARMSCRKKKRRRLGKKDPGWTTEGILARGNFPSTKTYFKALRKAKRKREFKREFKRWKDWECR